MDKVKVLIHVLKEEISECAKLKEIAKDGDHMNIWYTYVGKINGLQMAVEQLESLLKFEDVPVVEGVDQIKGKLEGLQREINDLRGQGAFTQDEINYFLRKMVEKIQGIITPEVEKCVFCESDSKLFDVWLNNKKKRICNSCWCKI